MNIVRFGFKVRLAAVLLLALLTGCETLALLGSTKEKLEDRVRDYQEMLRWQEPQAASEFVTEPLRQMYLERVPDLNKVKIVDYRIKIVDFKEAQKKATVVVEYDYHDKNGVKIKTASDRQLWEFSMSPNSTGWWLMSLPPNFP